MDFTTIRTGSEIERERLEFKADRYGHNGAVPPTTGRIKYMTHAGGYVMARRPHCSPFIITEELWCSFPAWNGLWHGER